MVCLLNNDKWIPTGKAAVPIKSQHDFMRSDVVALLRKVKISIHAASYRVFRKFAFMLGHARGLLRRRTNNLKPFSKVVYTT